MKKIFDGMTPPQIWEYIKNLPIEEREKLLFEEDMKKITQKGPQYLVGIEFNIPLFAADKQMYRCTNVEETISAPAGKTYTISFTEVKGMGYNVPERVDVALYVPTTDANGELTHLNMVEVSDTHGNLPLSKIITKKQNISSLRGLKQLFHKMAKSM